MKNILKVNDVYKSFESVNALSCFNMEIGEGEIHCLAGENGSGKSTIIKIISGVYTPDNGSLEISGVSFGKISPIEAITNGIQVIYQDFSIFPNLTVLENIAYNSELAAKRKIVNWKRLREIAEEATAKINFKVDFNALVGDLSVADKQLIAISRALINNAKLIIMDEPTTALTKREVDSLFKIILKLKANGVSTLFVSHKLDEVFEISDTFTIIRNGQNVFTGKTSELDEKKFSFYMTGKEFGAENAISIKTDGKPIMEAEGLTLQNAFYDINFKLFKGEILGISGLLGSGRTELSLALFGALKAEKGTLKVNGKAVSFHSIRDAVNCGIGYVPEDRLSEGLFLQQSIADNIIISNIDEISNFGLVNKNKKRAEIKKWVKDLAIATLDPSNPTTTLSGGNQQRVVLAKWLSRDLDILILNGPTVGVDIGSKHDIHNILKEYSAKGLGIIIISDDIPEILQNCNRILIMKAGRITDELAGDSVTKEELSTIMTENVV